MTYSFELLSTTRDTPKKLDDNRLLCVNRNGYQHSLYLNRVQIPLELIDCVFDFGECRLKSLANFTGSKS